MTNDHSIKNRGLILVLCFLGFFRPESKCSSFQDTVISTGIPSIDPQNRISISEKCFAFVTSESWNLDKRELKINKMDLETYVLSNIVVKVPTSLKILQCPAIALSDSFLLLQDDYNLNWFLFKLVYGEFKLLEPIEMPLNTMAFNCRVISSGLFLMTDIYNHHPFDKVKNTSLAIYNASERKFITVIHPEIPCIGLSHFPQKWITNSKDFITLAEPCGNQILIFDKSLTLIRTLKLPVSENWKNLPGNKIPMETSPEIINPKELIEKINPILNTFTRIETLQFINDSTLMIQCTGSTTPENELFIYDLKHNKFCKGNEIPMLKDQRFSLHPWQEFKNGRCITLEEDNYISDQSLSPEENEIRKNNFYETNDPEFIIRISKVLP